MSINSCLEHIAIAKPYKKKEIEEEEGFWEIKEKQTELSKNEGQSGPQKLKKQRVWITPNVVISWNQKCKNHVKYQMLHIMGFCIIYEYILINANSF